MILSGIHKLESARHQIVGGSASGGDPRVRGDDKVTKGIPMQRQLLYGKIHRATVTDAHIDYEGSITIDPLLMEAADILPHEKVLIVNLNNGARLESYAIPGKRGGGEICLNGGAAKHGKKGDLVIIITFGVMTEEEIRRHKPHVVKVDATNRILLK